MHCEIYKTQVAIMMLVQVREKVNFFGIETEGIIMDKAYKGKM